MFMDRIDIRFRFDLYVRSVSFQLMDSWIVYGSLYSPSSSFFSEGMDSNGQPRTKQEKDCK